MIRSLELLLALGVAVVGSGQTPCSPSSENGSEARLPVRLYDVAHVPRGTLDRSLELTELIFAKATVRICWERGEADATEALTNDMSGVSPGMYSRADNRNYIAAKIIRREPRNAFPGALGFALPFATAGPHAIVFYDRIENLLPGAAASLTTILGYALAHEIGHALLETVDHSPSGLMKSSWGKADFQRAAMNRLEFTQDEARVLHENAWRRVRLTANRESQEVRNQRLSSTPNPRDSNEFRDDPETIRKSPSLHLGSAGQSPNSPSAPRRPPPGKSLGQ